MAIVRVTHLDGKLPNLALMRLASFHRERGDEVIFSRSYIRTLFEPVNYNVVYGSAIFKNSSRIVEKFIQSFPNAILGGTGTNSPATVEGVIGDYHDLDYSIYPAYLHSIGFTQRGCRLKCKFCVVPQKEGNNRSASTIEEIWRGEPYPRNLMLLDNDFFGNEKWRERAKEIVDGTYKVCLSQGINVRLIDDEGAQWIARMDYRDTNFKRKRLYTAWDNLGHEKIFFRGIDRLEKAGIPPRHVMAYMLIGYSPTETLKDVFYRFEKMVERGVLPFPMVYDRTRKDLTDFQRYVVRGIYRYVDYEHYSSSIRRKQSNTAQPDFFSE